MQPGNEVNIDISTVHKIQENDYDLQQNMTDKQHLGIHESIIDYQQSSYNRQIIVCLKGNIKKCPINQEK